MGEVRAQGRVVGVGRCFRHVGLEERGGYGKFGVQVVEQRALGESVLSGVEVVGSIGWEEQGAIDRNA